MQFKWNGIESRGWKPFKATNNQSHLLVKATKQFSFSWRGEKRRENSIETTKIKKYNRRNEENVKKSICCSLSIANLAHRNRTQNTATAKESCKLQTY